MKKSYWIFVFVLVAGIFFVEYDLTKRTSRSAFVKKNPARLIHTKLAPATSTETSYQDPTRAGFDFRFQELTNEVSQLQDDPEKVEQRMKILAESMTDDDVRQLSEVLTNKKNNGDKRAMAVEILSRNQSNESLKQLENFIRKNESPAEKWSREREFESVLKAQAVEGIAAFPQKDVAISSLTALDQKIEESFLKDRIKRSVASLKNQAPLPEKQDNDALEKLVE